MKKPALVLVVIAALTVAGLWAYPRWTHRKEPVLSGTIEARDVVWSDGEVSGVLPAKARAGSVKLITPQAPGGLVTSEVVERCLNAEVAPFVAGATPTMTGGDFEAKVDFGRGLRPTAASGVDGDGQTVTLKIGRTVAP